jgi:GcrA cell cycle regulator
MRGDSWTAERIELLKKLWANGETAVAIAAHLGGMSRSAVLGKVFRLRLHTDNAAAAAPAKKRALDAGNEVTTPTRRRRSAQYKKRSQPAPAPARQHKTLLELTNKTCRWPHGRPGTDRFFFCGAPEADLEQGIPYCAQHMRRAYPAGASAGKPARPALSGVPHRWR